MLAIAVVFDISRVRSRELTAMLLIGGKIRKIEGEGRRMDVDDLEAGLLQLLLQVRNFFVQTSDLVFQAGDTLTVGRVLLSGGDRGRRGVQLGLFPA